jgi:transposase, IS5 family
MAYIKQEQYDIYSHLFQDPLEKNHELLLLAERIDWDELTDRLLPYYSRRGRRPKRIRVMVGLHILKHRFDLSDEEVVQGLHENVYWMGFCGVKLQPRWGGKAGGEKGVESCRFLDSSTMTKFRRRLGSEGFREMEDAIREILIRKKRMCPRSHFVDTTAQPKHIEYPTDTELLHRGRHRLVRTIKRLCGHGVKGIEGVRSFSRLSQKVVVEIHKLGKDRKERIEAGLRKLSGYAQEVVKRVPEVICHTEKEIRDLYTKRSHKAAGAVERLKEKLASDSKLVERVIHQAQERLRGIHVPNKVYSLHEPHVACIRKGKRATPNEYGTKVLISVDRHGYVVDHQEYASNPHDTELLEEACERWEQIFETPAKELGADRGFHFKEGASVPHLAHIEKVAIPTKGKTPHPHKETSWFKRLQKQRAKIEPIIGHLKADHGMDRCRYKGFEGDQINVSMASMAWNLRKWGKQLMAYAT